MRVEWLHAVERQRLSSLWQLAQRISNMAGSEFKWFSLFALFNKGIRNCQFLQVFI